jgi:choline-sulfatase
VNSFLALAALGVLWGGAATIVFRIFIHPNRITKALNRVVAHALELPLFIDEPALVLRAARNLLVANFQVLAAIWLPCAVMTAAFALSWNPLNNHFGFASLPAGQPAVVTIGAPQVHGWGLYASPGLAVETPAVRAQTAHEVSWRVRPVNPGPQDFAISDGVRVFHPGRSRLTRTGDSRLAWIEVPWPAATYFHLSWLACFVIFSFAGAAVFSRVRWRRPAVAALTVAFCGAANAQTPVILISVDTLRADHLSCYGYRRVNTPHIDSLTRGGTLFSQIDSQVPLTLPSHASLLTSTWPAENKVEENGALVPAGTLTLASVLKSHGYRTAAFIGSIALDRRYGLDQGFETYDSPFEAAPGPQNPYSARVTRDATLVFRSARRWLETNHDRPVFAFIHLYDLHLPYKLPGYSPTEPSLAGYDAELAYVDAALGRFIESLTQDGLFQKAIVVLLSDHGESLGEHGESGHGYFIYESTIHVPLLIHWPGNSRSGLPERVQEPGGLIDVAPTILDTVKIAVPPSFRGKNLFAGPRPVLSESVYARDAFGWAPLRSIRTGESKYIEAPHPELYYLASDPHELRNISTVHLDEAAKMKQRLTAMRPAGSAQPARSSATQQALRSLGYIAGPAGASVAHSNIDPKDRIREFESYTRAIGLMYAGRAREAVPLLKTILASDPHNDAIRVDLGHAELDAGRAADALHEWESILARDPGFTPASEAIGFYWMEKLDFARAEAAFERTLRVSPRDYEAHFAIAIVDDKLGRTAEAARHRRIVCEISPSTPGCTAAQ